MKRSGIILLALVSMLLVFVLVIPVLSAASAPVNLVKDPSFEAVAGGNKSDVWKFTMDCVSKGWYGAFISNATLTGKQAETCWADDVFTLTAKQVLGSVPAGKYTASVWISLGRADYEFAKVTIYNGDKVLGEADLGGVGNNDYNDYRLVKAEGIDVPAGANLTIAVSVKGGKAKADFKDANGYARIDDVAFVKTVKDNNLIADPSFEAVDGGNKSSAWKFTMDCASKSWFGAFISGAAHTGKQAETAWADDVYTLTAKQDFQAPGGVYSASAWISLGRADYEFVKLTVLEGAKVIGEADLGGAGNNDYNSYRHVKVDGISVPLFGARLTMVISVKGGKAKDDFVDPNGYVRIDDVSFTKMVRDNNLAKDPSFEKVDGGNKSDVWKFSMDCVSKGWFGAFISNATRTGKQAETCWADDVYTIKATQVLGLRAGKYTASAWISLGRANYEFAKVTLYNGDKVLGEADLGGAGNNDYNGFRLVQVTGVDVPVASNVTLVVSVKGGKASADFQNPNGYVRIDDVTIVKE